MRNHRIRTEPRAPLTPESAFVVHFAPAAAGATETVQGRIEHITSGQSMRFASAAELIGFMQHTVAPRPGAAPVERPGAGARVYAGRATMSGGRIKES